MHFGSSVEFQALLSVRLQLLHLWSTSRSAALAIGPATLRAFFNLSYASAGPAGPFAYTNEVLEYPRAVLGIVDLGMELQTEAVARGVLHTLDPARVAMGSDGEPRGRFCDLVVVALPHRLLLRRALEQPPAAIHQGDGGSAELGLWRLGGLAPVESRHELVSGADPENRDIEPHEGTAVTQLARQAHSGGTPREDQPVDLTEPVERGVVRMDLGVYSEIS